jgi:nitroreductase
VASAFWKLKIMTLPANEKPPEKNVFEAILARRSVRAYAPNELDRNTVQILLEAAVRAPTAIHEEPWAFVVVQDRQVLKQLSDRAKPLFIERLHRPHQAGGRALDTFSNPDFNIFHDAGTLIVICAKPSGPFVEADCWLAAENLMLAACAIGLGSCVIGSSVAALNTPEVKAKLGIPAEFNAVAPIIVGVPRGETATTSRKEPLILAWKQ